CGCAQPPSTPWRKPPLASRWCRSSPTPIHILSCSAHASPCRWQPCWSLPWTGRPRSNWPKPCLRSLGKSTPPLAAEFTTASLTQRASHPRRLGAEKSTNRRSSRVDAVSVNNLGNLPRSGLALVGCCVSLARDGGFDLYGPRREGLSKARSWPDDRTHLRRERRSMAFAIKAEVFKPRAKTFAFTAQKTMYGGKHIADGDMVFVFASENDGGQGLIARGVVTSAVAIAKRAGIARQTPRVSITIRRTALAKRPLGRSELR